MCHQLFFNLAGSIQPFPDVRCLQSSFVIHSAKHATIHHAQKDYLDLWISSFFLSQSLSLSFSLSLPGHLTIYVRKKKESISYQSGHGCCECKISIEISVFILLKMKAFSVTAIFELHRVKLSHILDKDNQNQGIILSTGALLT